MYNYINMTTDTRQYLNFMNSNGRNSKLYVVMAIAKALADLTPLPATPLVGSDECNGDIDILLRSFYNKLAFTANDSKLSALNEIIVIDIDLIRGYIFKFLKIRYNALYPNTMFTQTVNVMDFFGINGIISDKDVQYINDNLMDISKFYNFMYKLFKGMDIK